MKCYLHIASIRLSGKGWEIRHYLRGIASSAPAGMTLADWLDRRPAKRGQLPAPAGKQAATGSASPLRLLG